MHDENKKKGHDPTMARNTANALSATGLQRRILHLAYPQTRRSLTQFKARRSRLMTHASSLTQLKACTTSSLMTQAISLTQLKACRSRLMIHASSLTQLKACRSRLMIHASSLTQLKACGSSLMTLSGNQPDSTQGVQKPPDDTC
jgi:hypothetical protein